MLTARACAGDAGAGAGGGRGRSGEGKGAADGGPVPRQHEHPAGACAFFSGTRHHVTSSRHHTVMHLCLHSRCQLLPT